MDKRVLLLVMFMLIFINVPVKGETVHKVVLTADELKYDYEAKQIVATGNVAITYKEIKIHSDSAIIDQEQNILLATGNVRVDKDDDNFVGDRFLYYLEEQQGWLSPTNTTITSDDVKEPVRFQANESFIQGDDVIAKNSFVTSCNLEHPHYHLRAKEVEYYPDRRIILRHVTYYEHDLPMLYLPYLYISLEKDKENAIEFEIGHNDTDGWFALVGYNYFLNEQNRLKFESKLTELNGDLYGVKHRHIIANQREWSQEYQVIDKSDLGYPNLDYIANFWYEDKTNSNRPFEGDFSTKHLFDINGSGRIENILNAYLRGISPYPFVGFHYEDIGENLNRTMTLNSSWVYNINPSSGVNFYGNWAYYKQLLNNESNYGTNNFRYNLSYWKNFTWMRSSLRVQYNDTAVYDGNYAADNYKPDINFNIPELKLPLVNSVELNANYSLLEKFATGRETETGERIGFDLVKKWKLWENANQASSLSLNNSLKQRMFQIDSNALNGDSTVTSFGTELQYSHQFTAKLASSYGLVYSFVSGETNDFFSNKGDSALEPGAALNNNWSWNDTENHVTASLYSNYIFSTQAGNSTLTSRWDPEPGQKWISLTSAIDWDKGIGVTDLQSHYSLNDTIRFALYLNYNFESEAWGRKDFESTIKRQLTKNWKVEAAAQYSMVQNKFSIGNTLFTYDWHCRELQFRYDWTNQEFSFQIVFKAFPNASIQIDKDMQLLNAENLAE